MGSSIQGTPKKRGRPKTTGRGFGINLRLQPSELDLVDRFRLTESDQPSRPEAIRRLIDRGITTLSLERLSGSSPPDEAA